MPKELHVS